MNKLKENVQAVVKKIKEELTALKTETGTGIEGLKKDIVELKAHPVAEVKVNPVAEVKAEPAAELKPSPASSDDLIILKKETEETKTNLNKLKENV